MARGRYSAGKRQREADKARKREEKAERRRRNRENAPEGIQIATVEEIQVAAMRTPVDVAAAAVVRPRSSSGPPCRLFVGGLGEDVNSNRLRELFAGHGEVLDCSVATDRNTGESRGFGFVTMADRRAAAKAVKELDGQQIDGRILRVDVATERPR